MTDIRGKLSGSEALLFAFALLMSVVAMAQLAASPADPPRKGLVLGAIGGTLAVVVTARRSFLRWRSDPVRNRAWAWIAAGLIIGIGFGVVIGAVQAVWSSPGSSLEGDQRLLLSLCGIGAMSAIAVGLLQFPWCSSSGLGRALTWLDGLLVGFAVFLLARQLFAAPYSLPADEILQLLLRPPAAAAGLVVVAFIVVSRARLASDTPIHELLLASSGAAILGSVMALIYAPGVASAESWYWVASPMAVIGCALLTLAAASPYEIETATDHRLRERTSVLAPVLPLAAALTVVTWYMAMGKPLTPVATVMTVLLVVTVVLTTAVARLHALSVARTLELRVAERTLALGSRERWFRGLVQHSTDVITVLDREGHISYQTPSVERVFGYASGQLLGQSLTVLLRRDDVSAVMLALDRAAGQTDQPHVLQFPLRRADGEWIDVETTITSLLDEPDIKGIVLNSRDVTERLRLEQELTHQAYSDALTGLANRTMFRRCVVDALDRSTVPSDVAVVFLDLDGFKSVNDARGHAAGDVLLTHVAVRLRNCVRPGDLIARLGGDEFAILVCGVRAVEGAEWIAQRVTHALVDAFTIEGRSLHMGASIGISVNDTGDESADQMLRNADLAMYRAKSDDRTTHIRFEVDMHRAVVQRVQDENDLRDALINSELVLHYQPIVDLVTDSVVGVEALVRWNHPERGLLAPCAFVELAEQTGLIEALGAWVLDEAAHQASAWQCYSAGQPFRMAVNVSAKPLTADFAKRVSQAIERERLPRGALTLEITESILVDHEPGTMDVMHQLRSLGAQIAVDDFGTGYSSLSYLAQFPVDILKIDRAFVQHVGSRSEQAELARTIVQLGDSLNLTTVAEGIETVEQWEGLRTLGCPLGQGYYFARPEPADAVEQLLLSASTLGGVSLVKDPALA